MQTAGSSSAPKQCFGVAQHLERLSSSGCGGKFIQNSEIKTTKKKFLTVKIHWADFSDSNTTGGRESWYEPVSWTAVYCSREKNDEELLLFLGSRCTMQCFQFLLQSVLQRFSLCLLLCVPPNCLAIYSPRTFVVNARVVKDWYEF